VISNAQGGEVHETVRSQSFERSSANKERDPNGTRDNIPVCGIMLSGNAFRSGGGMKLFCSQSKECKCCKLLSHNFCSFSRSILALRQARCEKSGARAWKNMTVSLTGFGCKRDGMHACFAFI
jgi:hypothetical protein